MDLPKIYPITDTRIAGMSHAEQVERLVAAGATLIQLREKRVSPAEFYDDARAAIAIGRRHAVKILINDRVDLALALEADGVHLGQDDLPPIEARKLLGDDAIIGFSTHSIDQVKAAASMPVDYIAFGPIFATKTKERADPSVGLGQLSRIREIIHTIPLVAIGGIDPENIEGVLAAGACSVAVISAILARDIESSYRKLHNIVVKV